MLLCRFYVIMKRCRKPWKSIHFPVLLGLSHPPLNAPMGNHHVVLLDGRYGETQPPIPTPPIPSGQETSPSNIQELLPWAWKIGNQLWTRYSFFVEENCGNPLNLVQLVCCSMLVWDGDGNLLTHLFPTSWWIKQLALWLKWPMVWSVYYIFKK